MATVSDSDLKVYNAILDFVKDLNTNFGKRYKPVALYNRLLEKTTLQDVSSIRRHVDVFKSFFSRNSTYVADSYIGEGSATIQYSDRVYLNIRSILDRTDHSSHECIRSHLLLIYGLLNPGTASGTAAINSAIRQSTTATTTLSSDSHNSPSTSPSTARGGSAERASSLIPDIDMPDTAESKFISESIEEMATQFQNAHARGGNPMELMAGLMKGGNISKFMSNLQEKFQAGDLNMSSLLTTTQTLITKITPEGKEGEQIRKMVDMTKPLIEKMTGTINTGGEPNEADVGEIKKMADEMMSSVGGGNGGATSSMVESLISGVTNAAENGGDPSEIVSGIMENIMSNSLEESLMGSADSNATSTASNLPDLPPKPSANPLVGMFNSFVMSNLNSGNGDDGDDDLD